MGLYINNIYDTNLYINNIYDRFLYKTFNLYIMINLPLNIIERMKGGRTVPGPDSIICQAF